MHRQYGGFQGGFEHVLNERDVLFMNLEGWLNYIQSIHVTDMDLSLERVTEVAGRLNLLKAPCPVITVAGTNGKGSCVAGLEAIYMASGYQVGAFTSPVLLRHNEYVRVQGKDASDEQFCEAFEKIEAVRGNTTLTQFEFNTLAAFYIFQQMELDVWILEVGLGGRFDATNVIAADVAVVASIGIDHVDWLGDTREKIAYEKAGIFRKHKPAVCGDFDPPSTLIKYAQELEAPLFCQNKQFGFEKNDTSWTWWGEKNRFDLPLPKLALQNMATVLMAVELLQDKLPAKIDIIRESLTSVSLPGRIQVISGEVTQVFDVSHNPAAAEFLANWLKQHSCNGTTRAVFSMLADKDIFATVSVMKAVIDSWYVASLPVKRGADINKIMAGFQAAEIEKIKAYGSIKGAYQATLNDSKPGDRIVVFGSFSVVSEVVRGSD